MAASSRDTWSRSFGSFLLVLLPMLIIPGIGISNDKKAEDPVLKGPAAEEIVRLKREVDALETLYHLEATKTQMAGLLALAEKTAAKTAPATEAKASTAYTQTLKDLRTALIQDDEEKITALFEKLAELDDLEPAEIPEEFEISDAAMKVSPAAVKLLTPAQVVSYLAALETEVPDPIERIVNTVREGEELTGDEWKTLRDDTAKEVAWLINGFNSDAAKATTRSVSELLERGHHFKGEALKKELDAFEQNARRLAGGVSPIVVLQHYMERELAELLSNPRAVAALKARLEQLQKPNGTSEK